MSFTRTDEACPHAWDDSILRRPTSNTVVHREECAYCCRTCRHGDGTYVCMCCHTGVCSDHVGKHMSIHPTHALFTRIQEVQQVIAEEPVKDTNTLGVTPPKEYTSAICCAACRVEFTITPELAADAFWGIVHAPVAGAQEASSAVLDAGRSLCPHLVCLEQSASPFSAGPPTSSSVCSMEDCSCQLNNWMCVTCGAVGCPRAEAGGGGHALLHSVETGHPACVKLGTITPEGADFYCYVCDDAVDDVHFASHMAHFGIDIMQAKKTAKTLGEMEYDFSSRFDYDKITEAGTELTPVYGAGRTGIRNIGNTCYLASVLQCLMHLSPFQAAYFAGGAAAHQASCNTADPYDCHSCQMERMAAGLLTGNFSLPGNDANNGIDPRAFKRVIAQQHPEFSSGAQQDAQEYMLYMLDILRHHTTPAGEGIHPVDRMEYLLEQRVQCTACHKTRYSMEKERCLSLPVPVDAPQMEVGTQNVAALSEEQVDALRPRTTLEQCLREATKTTGVECRCEACGEPTIYETSLRFATFPDILSIYFRRAYFDKEAMMTKKKDIFVEVPEAVDVEGYRGRGAQPGEVAMEPTADTKTSPKEQKVKRPEVDPAALDAVVGMGFDRERAKHALLQTGMNVSAAIEFIFNNPEIDLQCAAEGAETAVSVATSKQVATDGPGVYELVAMVSHMGASAKTGHYVCHLKDRDTGKWILFNDEKVGESKEPPLSMASIYFFQRKT